MIGLHGGEKRASLSHQINSCDSSDYGAERIHLLAPGAENGDRNPLRTRSRHITDLAVGTENPFHPKRVRAVVRFTGLNLTNQAMRWVSPRANQARLGWTF